MWRDSTGCLYATKIWKCVMLESNNLGIYLHIRLIYEIKSKAAISLMFDSHCKAIAALFCILYCRPKKNKLQVVCLSPYNWTFYMKRGSVNVFTKFGCYGIVCIIWPWVTPGDLELTFRSVSIHRWLHPKAKGTKWHIILPACLMLRIMHELT